MSSSIDINRIIRQAKEQGFRHQITERNHHQFYSPNGKDIVVHSGTTSDHRGDENFMHEMKRAGYQHGLNSLGEALSAAGVNASPKPANGGAKLSVVQIIIDALARHPEGLSAATIKMIVMGGRPDLANNSSYSGLNTTVAKGFARKWPNGNYKLTDVDRSGFKTYVRNPTKEAAAPKTNGATPHPTVEVGERTGDPTIDADLQALDGALAALALIEGVVRKNREVLVQLAALKKVLGGA